ncbi:hypothetical protein DaDZ19_43380 [Dickeya ananatis]
MLTTNMKKILDTPAPSVMFSQLTPNGMVLSVTGYVGSPRMVSSAKSDLLFDIIKRLRAENIPLAVPQKNGAGKQRGYFLATNRRVTATQTVNRRMVGKG